MSNNSSSVCDVFGSQRCDAIIDVRITSASLSLIGCAFIIASIALFARHRNFAQRIILYLSMASLLDSIPYLTAREHPRAGALCSLQALWMTYFDWTVLLWIVVITFNVYMNLIVRIDTQHFEKRYHLFAWGFPALPALLPLIFNKYGPAGAWCWISEKEDAWRFGIWYIPMILLICCVGLVYGFIQREVIRSAESWKGMYRPEMEEEKSLLRKQVQALLVYPAIYLIASLFAVINRVQNAADPDHPVFALYLLQSLFSPMQGFINAVAYAFAGDFWRSCNRQDIARAWARRLRPSTIKELPIVDGEYSLEDDTASFGLSDSDEEDISYMAPGVHGAAWRV